VRTALPALYYCNIFVPALYYCNIFVPALYYCNIFVPALYYYDIVARYGWFSALMMLGSSVGSVTWAARMMQLTNGFTASELSSSGNVVQASAALARLYNWRALFTVAYSLEFLCLTAAKLMVLDRMSVFAAPQGDGARQR
jgi:hypothetical protein